MGDRGNICVVDREDKIYLYSHWSGKYLPKTLQDALKRGRDRWTDAPYLTRIIFCEMIKDEVMETTGYGISAYLTDWNYPTIFVDVDKQTVTYGGDASSPLTRAFTFIEFCARGDFIENGYD